jgi:uncharacterized protein (TIGR03067 family)
MARLFAVGLMFGFLILPAFGADDEQKDVQRIQGDWALVSAQVDGRDGAKDAKDALFTIQGDKLTIAFTNQDGNEERKPAMELTLTPETAPKRIDLVPEGGPGKGMLMPGIYELDGDVLKICFGEHRPKEFTAKQGSKQAMWVLKRMKK